MAGKRKRREIPRGESSSPSILERMSGAEAATVLKCLLDLHPELRDEAEAPAGEVLGAVSFLALADEVEAAVLQFDYCDLNARAGRHSWGYVEPAEAAWELLEKAVRPFVDGMQRCLDLGLEEPARQSCQGILLGLYRVRDGGGNDILNWAPDFAAEEAGSVLELWRKGEQTGKKGGRQLSHDFVIGHTPEWQWAAKSTKGSR